jgi:UDP-N-acetylglucosamine diphosphorylase/glucosamine-1-phosphate N-acetyltransferase
MNLILFDDSSWENLLPLTFARPVSDLRIGILTIAGKWAKILGTPASFITRPHLASKYPLNAGDDNLLVNGSLLPDEVLVSSIRALREHGALKKEGILLAARTGRSEATEFDMDVWTDRAAPFEGAVSLVDYPWKIFVLNGREIQSDFRLVTANRESERADDTVQVIGPGEVFIEPDFRGTHMILNPSAGPIYLGRGSEIMEGSVIRGPFALCEGSVVKLSAKIYGPTTIGPGSKVGGEINNSVIHSNSNKAHDGFLGNSVIGQWCNLGADTNNSNLKNDYSGVRVWNYPENRFIRTGLQFCGLFMGDHSKCGINTMFNTGTVVGFSANIFGGGFPRNFIPSFSLGGAGGYTTWKPEKAMEAAEQVMKRRGIRLTETDRSIFEFVYGYREPFRR